MVGPIASKNTSGNLASQLVIEQGQPVEVHGIVANFTGLSAAAHVRVVDNDDNLLCIIPVSSSGLGVTSLTFDWIAPNGLKLEGPTEGSSIDVIVYHSQAGA